MTPEAQTEHNHRLIYVFVHTVMDRAQNGWVEPGTRLSWQFLSSLDLLRLAIQETPDVLVCTEHPRGHSISAFTDRGHTQLWLWILPKMLHVLGSSSYKLTMPKVGPAIESFCRFLLDITSRTPSLQEVWEHLVAYFQSIVRCMLHLQFPLSLPPPKIQLTCSIPPQIVIFRTLRAPAPPLPPPSLRLPSDAYLERLIPKGESITFFKRCTYSILAVPDLLGHATRLLVILMATTDASSTAAPNALSAKRCLLWTLDALGDLSKIQMTRLDLNYTSITWPLDYSLQLASIFLDGSEPHTSAQNKLPPLLLLLCTNVVAEPMEIRRPGEPGEASRRLLCRGLNYIARYVRVTSDLERRRLVAMLQGLMADDDVLRDATYLAVCIKIYHNVSPSSVVSV